MEESDSETETAETYLKRIVGWFFLTGDRIGIATGIVTLLGSSFGILIEVGGGPLRNTQPLFYAYSGLIAGNLTLITVVASINQLLLSRQLNTPGEHQRQMEHVIEYRTEIEAATDSVAPVTPLEFLRLLVEGTRADAQRLGGFARAGVVDAGSEEIRNVAATLTAQMDGIDRLLTESDSGTFSVLSTMFNTNYAQQINELRRLRTEYDATFPDVVHDTIDDLIDRLQEIDVARQYFKTIYFQQELSTLSRWLFYTGLPAVAVAIAMLLVLTVPTGQPAAVPVPLGFAVPVTLAIGLVPLSVLASFFWRTATVTNLTAATLPFTTPEQER